MLWDTISRARSKGQRTGLPKSSSPVDLWSLPLVITGSHQCRINNEEEKGPGRIPDESSAYTSNRPSAYFKQLTPHAHARLPVDARRGSQGGGSFVVKPLLSWPDKAEKN
jgi:hypothetical protein